jgi:hypothetical protein
VGALKNKTTESFHGKEEELIAKITGDVAVLSSYREASKNCDITRTCVLAGEGVGGIKQLDGAEDVIKMVEEEAIAQIRRMNGMIT